MADDEVVYDLLAENVMTHTAQNGGARTVALTFDDGPGRCLSALLDILQKEGVPATFFWQSQFLYPGRPWPRVVDEGHQIGSHSLRHRDLTQMSLEAQHADLQASKQKIEQITGQSVRYVRPPFGKYNDLTLRAAQALDLQVVMWRIAALDWLLRDRPQQIAQNVAEHLEDKAIILLHELPQTVIALPALILAIRAQGYSFTTLDPIEFHTFP